MDGMVLVRLLIAASVTIFSVYAGPSVYSCPSVCTCYVDELHGLRTANCTGVKFLSEYKYNKLFHEIEVLNLQTYSDYNLIELWDDMFIYFTKLKLLNLSKCKINYLPKNVFKGLKKIYEINLAYNDIKHFDNSVFENIYTLYKLNLRGNPLQASYKPFISSVSLRELDLGYCGMSVLPNEFFHGVKKVSRLHLDGNYLQTIKEHVLPRGITHLNLANNRITNVPISTISSLSQLRWLNLGANPINCTCPLLNLQDRLSGRGIILDGDVRCAYPLDLKNVNWSKVNENELCNKETFRSRPHFRKPQSSKYIHSSKKDKFFENDKYSLSESFQADDPGKSADEFTDYDTVPSEEGYDELKDTKSEANVENDDNQGDSLVTDDLLGGKAEFEGKVNENPDELKKNTAVSESSQTPESSIAQTSKPIENESKEKVESSTPITGSEVEVVNDGGLNDKKLEKQTGASSEGNHEDNAETSSHAPSDAQNMGGAIPEKITGEPSSATKNSNEVSNAKEPEKDNISPTFTEVETTLPPMTTDPDLIFSGDPEVSGKSSSLDSLDEGLKREDEILPVVSNNEASETNTKDKNTVDIDEDNAEGNNVSAAVENESINEAKESANHDGHKKLVTEPPVESVNVSDNLGADKNNLEETVVAKDLKELNAGHINEIEETNENEKTTPNKNESDLSGKENNNFVTSGDKDKSEDSQTNGTVESVVLNEDEGSGDSAFDVPIFNASIPVVSEDPDVIPEISSHPSSEIPFVIDPNTSDDDDDDDEINNNKSSQEVVGKSDDSYEAMAPYIVVIGIVIFITVLILISIYKGCKTKKHDKKPVADVEANGTELQDMKSLLPKTTVNNEKHNNKYPNEIPSPETDSLIKEEKTDETDKQEPNESHDLNQNDSKIEPVIKNGKTLEGSPPPIEKTKAKLTVLLESIPRTPIFVQKRSATINNG